MTPLAATLTHYGVQFNPSRQGEQQVLCPVHEERRPSCGVSLTRQLWHCYSCGAGGDAITLIELKEGSPFEAAKAFLEDLIGAPYKALRTEPSRSRGVSRRPGNHPRHRGHLPARSRH